MEIRELAVAQLDQLIATVESVDRWAGRLRDTLLSGDAASDQATLRAQTVLRGCGDVAAMQAQLAYSLARLASLRS